MADRGALLRTIVEQAKELLDANSGGVYEYDSERKELFLIAEHLRPGNVGKTLKLGEGMAGRLIESGEPFMIVDDYNNWPGRAAIYQNQRPFGSVLEVPLRWKGDTIGVLYIDDRVGRRFTHEDARELVGLADHAAIAIATLESKERKQEFSAVVNLSERLLKSLDVQECLNLAVGAGLELLHTDMCNVVLPDREGNLVFAAVAGDWKPELVGKLRLQRKRSHAGCVIEQGTHVVFDDIQGETRFWFPPLAYEMGIRSGLGVPMMRDGHVVNARTHSSAQALS